MQASDRQPTGPLMCLKVLGLVSIGLGPHCAMLLADLGAEATPIYITPFQ